MLGVLVDAAVLMILLQTINEDDIGFGSAFFFALVASIGTSILAAGLVAAMGLAGIFVAAIIAAALVGVAVSALFGVEIKRAFLIGAIFMLVHMGIGVGVHFMFRA